MSWARAQAVKLGNPNALKPLDPVQIAGIAHEFLQEGGSILSLLPEFQPLFSPDTFSVYGHDIRNLLVLAATEVEMHCHGVLLANGARDRRFKMADYVVLAEVMKLPVYGVRFPAFPWLDVIRPFENWSATHSLPWWSAYNGVKHNREREFQRATLQHAFEAVSACIVLIFAQFGGAAGFGIEASLSHFYDLCEKPDWAEGECYCAVSDQIDRWMEQQHPVLAAS